MISHACDACGRRFRLDVELEPDVCDACSATLCTSCSETGCCRPVLPGEPCPDCDGSGALPVRGECPECAGLQVVVAEGLARECEDCEGRGWIGWSECHRCEGWGYPVPIAAERPVRYRRRAS